MGRNAPVDPEQKWTWKDKLIAVAILGIPLWLTIILSVIGDIDARKTRERLNSRPKTTWYEVLTPEERHKFGLDRMPGESKSTYTPPPDIKERFQKALREGSRENELIEKFSRGDYKDFYDYYDGAEGNIGDVDFDDISDYFGGGND